MLLIIVFPIGLGCDLKKTHILIETYSVDEQGSVGERRNLVHVKGVEDPLVLRPGDELEGRVGLDVTVDDPAEGEGQILDGRGEHNSGRVCKKTQIKLEFICG